jgi:hypothetical protein
MSVAWEYDPLTKALLDPGFVEWVDEVLEPTRGAHGGESPRS